MKPWKGWRIFILRLENRMRETALEIGGLRRKGAGLGGKTLRTLLLVKEVRASLPILNPIQQQGHLLPAQPSLQILLHFMGDEIEAQEVK